MSSNVYYAYLAQCAAIVSLAVLLRYDGSGGALPTMASVMQTSVGRLGYALVTTGLVGLVSVHALKTRDLNARERWEYAQPRQEVVDIVSRWTNENGGKNRVLHAGACVYDRDARLV